MEEPIQAMGLSRSGEQVVAEMWWKEGACCLKSWVSAGIRAGKRKYLSRKSAPGTSWGGCDCLQSRKVGHFFRAAKWTLGPSSLAPGEKAPWVERRELLFPPGPSGTGGRPGLGPGHPFTEPWNPGAPPAFPFLSKATAPNPIP